MQTGPESDCHILFAGEGVQTPHYGECITLGLKLIINGIVSRYAAKPPCSHTATLQVEA